MTLSPCRYYPSRPVHLHHDRGKCSGGNNNPESRVLYLNWVLHRSRYRYLEGMIDIHSGGKHFEEWCAVDLQPIGRLHHPSALLAREGGVAALSIHQQVEVPHHY